MSDFSEYINRLTKTYDGLFALVADYPLRGANSPARVVVVAQTGSGALQRLARGGDAALTTLPPGIIGTLPTTLTPSTHGRWSRGAPIVDQTVGELKTLFEQYVRRLRGLHPNSRRRPALSRVGNRPEARL
jgi:hypothetical protein